ncbi:hypothetical protein BDV96DRAFT_631182 [Lophiotrema nucula]|uniref:ferric-chelate reductase (NADPH) n=1 Tax=Lophiotrema nucula TaxID=690887 RepID=A0A6A5ZBR8_9PLEO|nr:hypothetical protein BDV96DRAFT_631182 [Lophiotrema nucula]
MDMDGMSMGGMSMGGLPPLIQFSKYYWAVVGTAIGFATLINIYNNVLYRQRMSAARSGTQMPAKPSSFFFVFNATLFALMREASNYSIWIPIKNRFIRLPTVGRASLILGNVVVLIVLCFYGFDLSDRWSREDIGYRCGFVTIAQIPLIFLLAGKNNIIGCLTGISYERLNWLHRWCARCLLLTATIHMGYFFADWAPYDYIGVQLKENTLVWKGVVAWALLVWIVFSSMTPIRGWCYEVFVLQHLVSFAVMIGFIYIHTPAEVHGYIWAPVALFWFDRVVRALRLLYANISFFHPRQRRAGQMSGLWACKAEFTPLPHKTTRIVIQNPPISWTPGQHVFLSCHSIVPLQTHPFTIASIPEDGRMEFLVKAETGSTKHFLKHAEKTHGLPASQSSCTRTVAIEGPYGCLRPLRQFDSVVFLAGSTGATFNVPLLRDILQGWKEKADSSQHGGSFFSSPKGAVTRHIRFVWVVKSRGQLGWFSPQLSAAFTDFENLRDKLRDVKLDITIYVTCDEAFTEEHKSLLSNITAPNLDAASRRDQPQAHGTVELRSHPSSAPGENEKQAKYSEEVNVVSQRSSDVPDAAADACGPNGTCCCKTTVDEESPDAIATCCCGNTKQSTNEARSLSRVSSAPSTNQKLLVHPSISVYAGRPNPRNIIRKSLEQALGESAVVVCGPQGLVADVKQDVCALSDERAVHKGTGAQDAWYRDRRGDFHPTDARRPPASPIHHNLHFICKLLGGAVKQSKHDSNRACLIHHRREYSTSPRNPLRDRTMAKADIHIKEEAEEVEAKVFGVDPTRDSDDDTKVSSSDENHTKMDLKHAGSSMTLSSDLGSAMDIDLDGIDDRLPYRQGWPLLPVLPVITSRKDIKKTLNKNSTHLKAIREILKQQDLDFTDAEVLHRVHEDSPTSKATLTLCVQARVHVNDEGIRNDDWTAAITALREYIQNQQLTLAIEIIDSRIFKGLYTHVILPHETSTLAFIKKKKHSITTLLNECDAEWTSLGFWHRGVSGKRAECRPTVLIGVPEPNLAVWWDVVLPKVKGIVKERLGVEIMYAVQQKC